VVSALSPARDARPASADEMRELLLRSLASGQVDDSEDRGVTEVLPRRDPPRVTPRGPTPPSRPEATPAARTPLPSPTGRGNETREERGTPRTQRTARSSTGTRRAGTSAGTTGTRRASSWDPAVLRQLEERLAPLLGPVAPHLVAKVSRSATDLEAFCQELATYIPVREERSRFLSWSRATLAAAAPRAKARTPPPTVTPIADWDPAVLQRARRDLAIHLGPMAVVIVRRVCPRARTPEELYELLSLEIPSETEREAFRRRAPSDFGHE